MTEERRLPASFRDPSGFLFTRDGVLYRQVNQRYANEYDQLHSSGLYQALAADELLIPHVETTVAPAEVKSAYRIIQPEPLPFVSYPYEWSFSQLRDAALLTLEIQKRALDFDMSLKDASAYNVQFLQGRPIFIDTLSFEQYREGEPWVAYRQFCQHFLAPLALMAYRDVRLLELARVHLDGVPLDLASRLLPARTRLSLPLLMHLHLHASAQRRYAGREVKKSEVRGQMSRNGLIGIVDTLRSAVSRLRWSGSATEWSDYYEQTNYSEDAFKAKQEIVKRFLTELQPPTVWDLGANTGVFSRLASEAGMFTVAFDVDPGAVEQNYRQVRQGGESQLLPLVMDLTNPSPAIGWNNQERLSLQQRGPAGALLALALVHHLAIGNNVPLTQLAAFFAVLAPALVIEFVPKEDSQVQRLLAMRDDIFEQYHRPGFEEAFGQHFRIEAVERVPASPRILYLMKRRSA